MTSILVMIAAVILKPDSFHEKSMRGSGVRRRANVTRISTVESIVSQEILRLAIGNGKVGLTKW